MDLLIIESFTLTPHLETAGEIAIRSAISGQKTGFSFIYVNNLDTHKHKVKSPIQKALGSGPKAKVRQLQSAMSAYGVNILLPPSLSADIKREIQSYAERAPRNLDKLRAYQYRKADLGLATLSSLISRTLTIEPDIEANRELIQSHLLSSATVYEKAKALILAHQPKKVVSFNGRFACAKPIFEAAKHLGVEVGYHERGATYERYQLYEKQPHDYVYIRQLIAKHWQDAGEDRVQKAHTFFSRRRDGDGIGWPSFTAEQKKELVPVREEKIRQIVYYSSSDDEFAATGELSTQPIFGTQRQSIKFLIDWVAVQEGIQLTIRVHPHLQKKSARDRNWWQSLRGPNVTVIPSDSPIDSYALMNWADIVVTYGSTVGIEANYWGTPSILLGDSFYSGMNCVYEPQSTGAVVQLLTSTDLRALPQENCLPYGYHYVCQGIRYQYYRPDNLFAGKFEDEYLTQETTLYKTLRKMWYGYVK